MNINNNTSWRIQNLWQSCAPLAIVVTLLALVPRAVFGAIEYGTDWRSVEVRLETELVAEPFPPIFSGATGVSGLPFQGIVDTEGSGILSQWGRAGAFQQSWYLPSELMIEGGASLGDSASPVGTLFSSAQSHFHLEFTVDVPTDYTLTAKQVGTGFNSFLLQRQGSNPDVLISSFTPISNGTLIPGNYLVEFDVSLQRNADRVASGDYAAGNAYMTFTVPEPSSLVLAMISLIALLLKTKLILPRGH